jgi:purine nucleoside phosphorylase
MSKRQSGFTEPKEAVVLRVNTDPYDPELAKAASDAARKTMERLSRRRTRLREACKIATRALRSWSPV